MTQKTPKLPKTAVKQGYPKKQVTVKKRVVQMYTNDLIHADPWQLPLPSNAYYGTKEMQYYFTALSLDNISGEQAKRNYWENYGFNLPDQQTVRVRTEKSSVEEIEGKNNQFSLLNKPFTVLKHLKHQKRLRVKMRKQQQQRQQRTEERLANNPSLRNSRRRQLRKQRKMQRERGVKRPTGNYLALDEHNDPYYGIVDVPLVNGENLASYLVKDRQKNSTKMFYQYLTVYSFEHGIRQVLGFHLMRRESRGSRERDGSKNNQERIDDFWEWNSDLDGGKWQQYLSQWKREPYGVVVKRLLDPILEHYVTKGVVGDGRYYDGKVIKYLLDKQLDFVIRADFTKTLKDWSKKEDLLSVLNDGEGKWFDGGISFKGRGMKAVKLKVCIVNRNGELVPLALPESSELTPEQALLLYEERFGIETNYRELEKRIGFTTSISPQYRVALFASAVNLFNIFMNYIEHVITRSNNPEKWQVSMQDLKDVMRGKLGDIASQAVQMLKERKASRIEGGNLIS